MAKKKKYTTKVDVTDYATTVDPITEPAEPKEVVYNTSRNPNSFDSEDSLSKSIMNKSDIKLSDEETYNIAVSTSNIHSENSIRDNLYTNTFRFGIMNPYETMPANCKEVLFFTKPDLNICDQNPKTFEGKDNPNYLNLQSILDSYPYWRDLYYNRPELVSCLQQSFGNAATKADNFNHLLQNCVISNLDVPGLDSDVIDTPNNVYGVGYSYRGSSESSDDNPEFSLEFRDTKYLDIYNFFKAYEEYETLKHHGVIRPIQKHTENKRIHDQFSIYKFILDEDMETILYYGKMYGVMPKSLPRDVFSNPQFDGGLSYSINFKGAFYEDMRPEILADFNNLSVKTFSNAKNYINTYNTYLSGSDTRFAKAAFIYKLDTQDKSIADYGRTVPGRYIYKLKWKGN